jgi:uncharacterized protein (UPF0335 family)
MEKNATNTILVPLQSKTRNGKTAFVEVSRSELTHIEPWKVYYFAYMRRSTTKIEQAESLLQQEEGIKSMAQELGISLDDIRSYSESKSWFENRTREEWNRMIKDIDIVCKWGGICHILCRDSSRLSRNPRDNMDIADRLFGDNDFKKRRAIDKIHMLWDGASIITWTPKSDKESVVNELHNNYTNSIWTKKKSSTWIILKLQAWEFPYASPHWLERIIPSWVVYQKPFHKWQSTVLKQKVLMKFIKRLFEMKVEGKTSKEMSDYLKKFAGIYIPPKKIVETIIQNTLYKGEYTEKTTGRFFDNIKFYEGRPPIEKSLWERANATIWKRGNGHGKGQTEHLLVGRIKTEQGTTFQIYIAKWKSGTGIHYNYKGISKDDKWKTINVYVAETEMLNYVAVEISKIVTKIFERVDTVEVMSRIEQYNEANYCYSQYYGNDIWSEQGGDVYVNAKENLDTKSSVVDLKDLPKMLSELFSLRRENIDSMVDTMLATETEKMQEISNTTISTNTREEIKNYFENRLSIRDEILQTAIQESPFFKRLQEELDFQKSWIEQLEKQRLEIQEELKGVYGKAFKMGYDKEFADEQCLQIQQKISRIDNTINWLSENTNLQGILDRLPTILAKIVELSSNAISKGKIKEHRDDIRLILDIITVELQISNKKELKIKLLEGLEDLLDDENWNWSHWRESNPRPRPYHGRALPLSHSGISV